MVITFALGTSLAQTPKDVEGWRGARWGMTEDELLAAFKNEIIRVDRRTYRIGYSTLAIKDFEIFGDRYDVAFVMDNTDQKLLAVNLSFQRRGYPEGMPEEAKKLLQQYPNPDFRFERERTGV